MVWDAKGCATITDAPAADFWELAQGPTNPAVGLFNCCLIDLKQGAAKGCPLVTHTHTPCGACAQPRCEERRVAAHVGL